MAAKACAVVLICWTRTSAWHSAMDSSQDSIVALDCADGGNADDPCGDAEFEELGWSRRVWWTPQVCAVPPATKHENSPFVEASGLHNCTNDVPISHAHLAQSIRGIQLLASESEPQKATQNLAVEPQPSVCRRSTQLCPLGRCTSTCMALAQSRGAKRSALETTGLASG